MVDHTTAYVLTVIFVATLIRSTLGFGEGLVAVPLLALRIAVTVAAPLAVLISVLVAAVIVVQDWRRVELRSAGALILAALPGIPLGVLLLTKGNEHIVKSILGAVIIAFSIYSLVAGTRLHLAKDHRGWLLGCGFLSGVLGGAYGINGPPLAVYGALRRWSPQHFRATLQGYFLPASLIGLASYAAVGLWSADITRYFLLSLPAVGVAILLGRAINHRMKGHGFLQAVYIGLIVLGGVLIGQGLFAQGPVVPDPAPLNRVRSLPGSQWDSADTEHFRLYTEKGSFAAQHLDLLRGRAERAWRDDLALIRETAYPHRIHIFYFASKARMDSIFSVPGEGQAYPEAQLVMLLMAPGRDSLPADRHEIMHVLSANLWGWSAEQAVWENEGLANVASLPDWPYTIDQMAAQARQDGDHRAAADLTGAKFFSGGRLDHFRAYMLASSFVGYLLAAGGVDKFRQLWQRGLDAAPSIYGADVAALGERWEATLRSVELPANGISLERVMGCACR